MTTLRTPGLKRILLKVTNATRTHGFGVAGAVVLVLPALPATDPRPTTTNPTATDPCATEPVSAPEPTLAEPPLSEPSPTEPTPIELTPANRC